MALQFVNCLLCRGGHGGIWVIFFLNNRHPQILIQVMSCLSCNINATRFMINFDTMGVLHMQFRNQFVLALWMWVIDIPF